MLINTSARAPIVDLTFFAPFNGLGVGARGFLDAQPAAGGLHGRWVCLGGVDSDAGANANATRICGVPFTTLDLFSREQYIDFHGKEPPTSWREAMPSDILKAAGYQFPDALMLSPPCKGYSGLLAESLSRSAKYVALNGLAMRGVWLCLEAFKDSLPHLILLENVPRMAARGRRWLDQIQALLRAYGYSIAETVHDCGQVGGLAQTRKRFLMVARRIETVPNYLYQPPIKPLRGVGEVLGRLPVPGTSEHPLHQLPRLAFKTWTRLAFVEAGRDWRSLNRLRVIDGQLADFGLMPAGQATHRLGDVRYDGKGEYSQYGVMGWTDTAPTISGQSAPGGGRYTVADPRVRPEGYHSGVLGVNAWEDPAVTLTGTGRAMTGAFNVADPRCPAGWGGAGKYLVTPFDQHSNTLIAASTTGNGAFAVADPRLQASKSNFNNIYRVVRFTDPSPTVSGGTGPAGGGLAVADPRTTWPEGSAHTSKYRVTDWEEPAGTATCTNKGPGSGALCVADPRPGMQRERGSNYLTAGHYGVVGWEDTAGAVTGSGQHDNGRNSVADPRLPDPNEKLACLIVAEDGTWHRPFSTLETAALQAIFEPEDYDRFTLVGRSDEQIREWIGNAIPRSAAEAMADQFGQALLLRHTEQTFILRSDKVWVQPLVIALQCGHGSFGEAS